MYDEAEYGDMLKSWVVPAYMLCAMCVPLHYDMMQSITEIHENVLF